MDLLYEDISQKLKGSLRILEIAKNPDNLEELSRNGLCNFKFDILIT